MDSRLGSGRWLLAAVVAVALTAVVGWLLVAGSQDGGRPLSAGMARAGPARTGVYGGADVTGEPTQAWEDEVAPGQVSQRVSAPLVAGGLVVVVTDEHVVAFDVDGGRRRWRVAVPGANVQVRPVLADGAVVVATASGLVGVSLEDPRRVWQVDDWGLRGAATDGQRVYATNAERSTVAAFEDGRRLWTYTPGRVELGVPAAGGGLVAVADSAGTDPYLAAVDAGTGDQVWTRRLPAAAAAPPLIADGRVHFVDSRARLVTLDAADGQRRWRQQPLAAATPVKAGSVVWAIYGQPGGRLFAVDAADGSFVSGTQTGAGSYRPPVATGGSVLAAGARDGRVTIAQLTPQGTGTGRVRDVDLDADQPPRVAVGDNGRVAVTVPGTVAVAAPAGQLGLAWQQPVGQGQRPGVVGTPVIAGQTLYAATGAAGLVGFDLADGIRTTRLEPALPPVTGPAASSGQLVAVLADAVVAYRREGGLLDWRASFTADSASPPLLDDGRAVVPRGQFVQAIDRTSGDIDGGATLPRPDAAGRQTKPQVSLAGDTLLATDGRRLYRLDLTANEATRLLETSAAIVGPAPTAEGAAFTATASGTIRRIPVDGSSHGSWQTDLQTSISQPPAVTNRDVLIGTDDGRLIAINRQTGQPRWQTDLADTPLTAPAVGNQLTYLATDKQVVAVDPQGQTRWRHNIDNHPVRLVPADGRLAVVTTAGVRLLTDSEP